MGEPQLPKVNPPPTLPPGYGFYPSEEQLLCRYLTDKNCVPKDHQNRNFCGCDVIRELDLYDCDPFELPDIACFSYGYGGRRRHWYCYTVKYVKANRGKSRKVRSGYWKRLGIVKNVLSGGANMFLGTRTTFVFYLGNSLKDATRTDWTMYEYALDSRLKTSFVLCRVFVKSRHRKNVSEIAPSSCAEESDSAVRHIGIQHDGYLTPDAVDAKTCDDSSVDRKNEILVCPLRHASELDEHQVMTAPATVATFPCTPSPQGSQQGGCSGLPAGDAMFGEAVTSQHHLLSILEEDYIELDDLI